MIFDPPTNVQADVFSQTPDCLYDLYYVWRNIDLVTGLFTVMPPIFLTDSRDLTIEIQDPLTDYGMYKLSLKGNVPYQYMFPEKADSFEVWVEVVNPCLDTTINSDRQLTFESTLEVPLGDS